MSLNADTLEHTMIELDGVNYLNELYERRAFTLWKYLVDNEYSKFVDLEDCEYEHIQMRRFYCFSYGS